jgi:catechol 2,3-dioxygenase-like lactoylglutathione lyase family enzyme
LIFDLLAEGKVGSVPYDPLYPVHTAWDLGIDDETAIWFFQAPPGPEIRVIDHEHGSNMSLQTWIAVIKDKKYLYGTHLGPHDIHVREWSTGQERINFAKAMGVRFDVVPRHSIADGIQAVRTVLPRCRFDSVKCNHGIEALKSYRKEYSQRLSVYRDRPYHDWASNPADAFRTLAMGLELINSSLKPLRMKTLDFRAKYGDFGWML